MNHCSQPLARAEGIRPLKRTPQRRSWNASSQGDITNYARCSRGSFISCHPAASPSEDANPGPATPKIPRPWASTSARRASTAAFPSGRWQRRSAATTLRSSIGSVDGKSRSCATCLASSASWATTRGLSPDLRGADQGRQGGEGLSEEALARRLVKGAYPRKPGLVLGGHGPRTNWRARGVAAIEEATKVACALPDRSAIPV